MRNEAEAFMARLMQRRPELKADLTARLAQAPVQEGLEGTAEAAETAAARVLETIVSEQRPVFFADVNADGDPTIDLVDATLRGVEARFLADELRSHQAVVAPLLSRVGRIDVEGMMGAEFVGTGWVVDDGIVVTNRHVAAVVAEGARTRFSFRAGASGQPLALSFATGHLKSDPTPGLSIPIASVLYIEPKDSAVDIAFLQLSVTATTLSALPIRVSGIGDATPLCVLGYPAKASPRLIPDQQLMCDLFRDAYDVKRVAPGFVARQSAELITHDCTTLGGNSGSALVVIETGEVAGLHFAGVYLKENQAVPARILRDYRDRRRWTRPPAVETARSVPSAAPAAAGPTTITIAITITGGTAAATLGGADAARSVESVEQAAVGFLRQGPAAIVAARLGYDEDGGAPLIVASVPQSRMAEAATWPATCEGVPVRYEAATLLEQIEARAGEEAVGEIAYDDDARRGPEFALSPVSELMEVRAHLSPEYGFEELQSFFARATGPLQTAMYEIQGLRMGEMIEDALARGVRIELAADRLSAPPKPGEPVDDDSLTIEVSRRFQDWGARFGFRYQIVPLGRRGLVASAYHIKVAVDGDSRFWLSSGNWKNRSSQPLVDETMRRRATETDLPGNRDWHVIVDSATLADRFRNHIRQDVRRSGELAQAELAEAEPFVRMPALPEAVEERKPPSRVLAPLTIRGQIKAQPLLTPDRDGRAYTDPMLALIRSARRSLLFQIPYIGMRSNPAVHRGNIDELIDALVDKLLTLDDARVLLRGGNRGFSDNRHVSWYLQARGVAAGRVRQLEDHHTKGMVLDGQRVMIGSHNWSSQGVSANRDASIIFSEPRLAGYFREAFEIDWDRASPVAARRFVREMPELVAGVDEAAAPAGSELVPLGTILSALDD